MLLVLLCLPLAGCLGYERPPTTWIPQGQLEGRWFVTRGGRTIAGFLGIPFAAPPLGELRFLPPQLPQPWKGVYNATVDTTQCYQALVPIGSEDCLYLNVYTPDVDPRRKLAVMVFIFGGAFEIGDAYSYTYGPQYILDEDVVYVSLNYRLGVLGFLSLENRALPGNLGLKDQRAALRWVKHNIRYFGGDPNKITIFGQSAGAASVHYHMKFTAHEGLFRAGVCLSGSTFSPWAFQQPGAQERYVKYIAERTSCLQKDPWAFVECLRKVPAAHFSEILGELLISPTPVTRKINILKPVLEPPDVEDALVTADPRTLPTDMPLIIGVTDYECLGLNTPPYLEKDKTDALFKLYDENYRDLLPINLQYNETARHPHLVSEMLKKFYLGEKHFARQNYLDIVDLFSDGSIVNGVYRSARSNRHKTYVYKMSYMGKYSVVPLYGSTARYGVAHGDDLFFLFTLKSPPTVAPPDLTVSQLLVKFLTNFANYLDPSPMNSPVVWHPVRTRHIEYLNIGQFNSTMKGNFFRSRMEFWDDLPFGDKPYSLKWGPHIHSSRNKPVLEEFLDYGHFPQTFK